MGKEDQDRSKPAEETVLVFMGGSWSKRIGESSLGEVHLTKLLKQIQEVANPYYQSFYLLKQSENCIEKDGTLKYFLNS